MKKKYKQHATVKSIIGIVIMLVLFSAIVLVIGYNILTNALLEQYSDGAYLTAKTAAGHVDADRMDAYVESGGEGEEYSAVWKELDSLCNSSGSTFIYVIIPTEDYSHIEFIFSTIDHNSKYTKYDFGFLRETTNDEYKTKYRELYEKKAERELLVRDKGYIETDPHITVIVPLTAGDGSVKALLCVQRQMDVLLNFRNKFLGYIILALIILIIVVVVGQSLFLHRTLLRPLKLISDEAIRFSSENTVPETKLHDKIRNKDEIGGLAESIDLMETQIHEYIDNITRITADKQRIETELSLATRIQTSMLPNIFPAFPDRKEFDIYASMKPAKEVGGDFYDFFLVDDDHLALVIADVSGKGIPAALFMMISKTVIQNYTMTNKNVKLALEAANAQICKNNREDMFVTVWLGILDLKTGVLTAANAGHEFPVVKQQDGPFEIFKDKHGLFIGGFDTAKYSEYEIKLEKGAKLFLYTDGLAEATDANAELFGFDRIVKALRTAEDGTPKEIVEAVDGAVNDFVKDAPQFDDLTMLCVEYKGIE